MLKRYYKWATWGGWLDFETKKVFVEYRERSASEEDKSVGAAEDGGEEFWRFETPTFCRSVDEMDDLIAEVNAHRKGHEYIKVNPGSKAEVLYISDTPWERIT